jgi:2-C-methyl-D-erythritol 4-phosphate cytidylyltransferase
MEMKQQITAIILAAGQGKRMNSKVQKQFLLLQGKPLLYYSLRCFQECREIDRMILVTGENEIDYCRENIIHPYGLTKVTDIVAGGKERYDSVEHGLQHVSEGIVMIHDGARPFVTETMIQNSLEAVKQTGACTVGVPVKDTIKVVRDGRSVETPDRTLLWQIQTPQTFQVDLMKQAYCRMRQDLATSITDDTMLVERYCNTSVCMVEGSYCNIKITTPEDMIFAEALLQK